MKRPNFNETYRCIRYFRSCFCFDSGEINGSINGKQTSIQIQICNVDDPYFFTSLFYLHVYLNLSITLMSTWARA